MQLEEALKVLLRCNETLEALLRRNKALEALLRHEETLEALLRRDMALEAQEGLDPALALGDLVDLWSSRAGSWQTDRVTKVISPSRSAIVVQATNVRMLGSVVMAFFRRSLCLSCG